MSAEPPTDRTRMRSIVPVVGALAAIAVLVAVRVSSSSPGASPSTSTVPSKIEALPSPVPEDNPPTLSTDDLGGIEFKDVTAAAGINGTQTDEILKGVYGMTSGALVADLNGDQRPDVFLTRVGKYNALYLNDGNGTFHDAAVDAGVAGADPTQGSTAAAAADIDGDGHLDLFVAGYGSTPDALYVNDGAGHFRNEVTLRGLATYPAQGADDGSSVHGATFFDIDHDGWMDLIVTQWDTGVLDVSNVAGTSNTQICANAANSKAARSPRAPGAAPNRSRLYHNDGRGHFVDITADSGLDLDRVVAFTPQFIDLFGSGYSDLVLTGDVCTSRIYRNLDGTHFADITNVTGVGTDENGMGSVIRDVNGDGRPDWFITSVSFPLTDGACVIEPGVSACSGNRLFLNQGDGTFKDTTDQFGVRNGWWGWGAAIEDFGNDGRLSITMTNGYAVPLFSGDGASKDCAQCVRAQLLENDPMRFWVMVNGTYVNAARSVGLTDTGIGHALIPFDYDGDGRLDILVAHTSAPPTLYHNETRSQRHWIDVALNDPLHPGNRQGVGAKVAVTRAAGDPPVVGWIATAGSYESQKPAQFHVGLGDRGFVTRVEVWWPGETEPQILENVAADRVLVVNRDR